MSRDAAGNPSRLIAFVVRLFSGLGVTLGGAAITSWIYASQEGEGLGYYTWGTVALFVLASGLAFGCFLVIHRMAQGKKDLLILGSVSTYFCLIGVFILWLLLRGNAEEVMWLPVAIFFGIPSFVPIVIAAWLGSMIVLGVPKETLNPNDT